MRNPADARRASPIAPLFAYGEEALGLPEKTALLQKLRQAGIVTSQRGVGR